VRAAAHRVKSLTGLLNGQARAVNLVWNFCNDTQKHALSWWKKWPTGKDGTNFSQDASIHARIANAKRDFHHKRSTRIVREFDYIAVGNVNAAGLAKTSMAKSVLDAGWSSFRNMLRYKAIGRGAWHEEVNEAFTTQVCSGCGTLPDSRPKGIADLGIRNWTCLDCGCVHDRDVNAAKNILNSLNFRVGHDTLAVGIPSLQGGEDVKHGSWFVARDG